MESTSNTRKPTSKHGSGLSSPPELFLADLESLTVSQASPSSASNSPKIGDGSIQYNKEWQWHWCCEECDGFNCMFSSQDHLPLEDIVYLGHGKEGYVTKVRCQSQRVMARKVIKWYGRTKLLQQIQEEVRILRSLRHHHIVDIRGSYIQGKTFYGLLMEPAAECDLHDFLDRLTSELGDAECSAETQAQKDILWEGFGCLASALAFIHERKIKHRDIKPQNILVHLGKLFFTDFGIAKDFSERSASGSTGPAACTRRYAAPEVLGIEGVPHSRSADIYSLGCVFIELLTVLASRRLEEFFDFVNEDVLHKNLDAVHDWLVELSNHLEPGGYDFLFLAEKMIDNNARIRPSAENVWMFARETQMNNGHYLCGTCCDQIKPLSGMIEFPKSSSSKSVTNHVFQRGTSARRPDLPSQNPAENLPQEANLELPPQIQELLPILGPVNVSPLIPGAASIRLTTTLGDANASEMSQATSFTHATEVDLFDRPVFYTTPNSTQNASLANEDASVTYPNVIDKRAYEDLDNSQLPNSNPFRNHVILPGDQDAQQVASESDNAASPISTSHAVLHFDPDTMVRHSRGRSPVPVEFPTKIASPAVSWVTIGQEEFKVTIERTSPTRRVRLGKPTGGRRLGLHLSPDKAANAKLLRHEGACWICCLRKNSCTPGEVCARCTKRQQRIDVTGMQQDLGCDRTKLTDLVTDFIPQSVTEIWQRENVLSFCSERISFWITPPDFRSIKISLSWGHGPWIQITENCFEVQLKARSTIRRETEENIFQTAENTHTIPVALSNLEEQSHAMYSKYLDLAIDAHLDGFPQVYSKQTNDKLTEQVLQLMCSWHSLLGNKETQSVLRLIVATYILTHDLVIPPEKEDDAMKQLVQYKAGSDDKLAAPDILGRQLKVIFALIHKELLAAELKRLQQILRSSRGPINWRVPFSMLGLAIVEEKMQLFTFFIAESSPPGPNEWSYNAQRACKAIDERFEFMTTLCRLKYRPMGKYFKLVFSETSKLDQISGPQCDGFVAGMISLVKDNYEWLMQRRDVKMTAENHSEFSSRLIARFLLAFTSDEDLN